MDQYLLACLLGELRGTLTGATLKQAGDDLARLPRRRDLEGQHLRGGIRQAHLVGTDTQIGRRERTDREIRRSEAYMAEGQRLTRTGS